MTTDTFRFLSALYVSLSECETIELRWKAESRVRQSYHSTLEGAAKAASLQASKSDVWYGVATRDGKGGKKTNIVSIPAVWCDLDAKGHTDAPRIRIERAALLPSAIIASGAGIHAYWFLDEPLGKDSIPAIESVNKAISAALGGDSTHDASRVLRLPGTFNHKYAEPVKVQLLELEPERRYSLEELKQAFQIQQPELVPLKVKPADTRASGGSFLPCREVLWQGVEAGARNNAAWQLALDMKKQDVSLEVTETALKNWNKGNKPPLEEAELSNTIASVYSTEYAGLGCDKYPMLEFCQPNCPVKCKAATEPIIVQPQGDSVETVHSLSVWTWQALLNREVTPPDFICEGLIPRRGVTLLTGEGGIGKSFLSLDLAYSVAGGDKFLHNFDCVQGPVLMIDLENDEASIARRVQKITVGRRESKETIDDIPVYVVKKGDLENAALHIDEERGKAALRNAIESYCPSLLIIDPLVAIHGKDENDNLAMRQVVMLLQEIARNNNLGVVLIHHPRKRGMFNDPGQMIRGASDLRNAVDSHLFVRKVSKEQAIVEHDKSRHATPVPKFTIEMKDNDAGTATYIRYTGGTTESLEKEALARESLLNILLEAGECRRSELISKAENEGVAKSTTERALKSLLSEGKVIQPVDRGPYQLAVTHPELDM